MSMAENIHTFDASFIGAHQLGPSRSIMLTSPCNDYPLIPHFYIVKMEFTEGIHYFLIFAVKYRLWVLVRTASLRRF